MKQLHNKLYVTLGHPIFTFLFFECRTNRNIAVRINVGTFCRLNTKRFHKGKRKISNNKKGRNYVQCEERCNRVTTSSVLTVHKDMDMEGGYMAMLPCGQEEGGQTWPYKTRDVMEQWAHRAHYAAPVQCPEEEKKTTTGPGALSIIMLSIKCCHRDKCRAVSIIIPRPFVEDDDVLLLAGIGNKSGAADQTDEFDSNSRQSSS